MTQKLFYETCYHLQLLSTATFFGAIFCFSAFCFKNLYAFIVFFLIGEILVFATQVRYITLYIPVNISISIHPYIFPYCRVLLISCVSIPLNQVCDHYLWLCLLCQFMYSVMCLPLLLLELSRYVFLV